MISCWPEYWRSPRMTWCHSVLSIHHQSQWPSTRTPVGTFSQLEDGALEPASCNRLATKKPRQTKPLQSEEFDLDTMNLSSPQRKELASLLDQFTDIFSSGPADLGQTGIMQHCIDTGDHPPIKQAPRRVPMHQQGTVCQHVEDVLQHGVIQPSTSLWATPNVLVKKKDGTTCFCVDYRKLNDMTRKDAYPLPHIDETLDALAGAKGCFPFTKRFRKFRLGCKWNMIFRFVPLENFREKWNFWKVVPFSRWKFSDGTVCSIYGFRKGLPVPGPSRPYLRQGNMAATPSVSSVASVSSAFYECSVCHGLAPDLGT